MDIPKLAGALAATLIFALVFLVALRYGGNGPLSQGRRLPTHVLIVLGSGGHTEEMLSMLRRARLDFNNHYTRRTYVVSAGDAFSARKAAEFEQEVLRRENQKSNAHSPSEERGLESRNPRKGSRKSAESRSLSAASPSSYAIVTVPRARKVHQSFLTAPFSTFQCLWSCVRILHGKAPDQAWIRKPAPANQESSASSVSTDLPGVILTNGPGTAVCVIVAARILRVLNAILPRRVLLLLGICGRPEDQDPTARGRYLRTIFIESWARVTTLSLSGKILLPIVDRFLVQWEGLEGYSSWLGGKTEYAGNLIC